MNSSDQVVRRYYHFRSCTAPSNLYGLLDRLQLRSSTVPRGPRFESAVFQSSWPRFQVAEIFQYTQGSNKARGVLIDLQKNGAQRRASAPTTSALPAHRANFPHISRPKVLSCGTTIQAGARDSPRGLITCFCPTVESLSKIACIGSIRGIPHSGKMTSRDLAWKTGARQTAKTSCRNPSISPGPALVANSLCPWQAKRTMRMPEVQIAKSG